MAKISVEEAKARLQSKPLEQPASFKSPKRLQQPMTSSTEEKEDVELVEIVDDNLFIFKKGKSFVLSPADDVLSPVIGEFDEIPENGEIPENLKDWLDTYSKEINYFQDNEAFLAEEYEDPQSANVFELIDLGLSVKWATMNIGATKPEEIGNYYAWGETETKTSFTTTTYEFYDTVKKAYKSIGADITKSDVYDPAYKMDERYCMPTEEQFNELITKCTWTKTALNNADVWEVKGPNGNRIFLPIDGYKDSSKIVNQDYCYLWTSTHYSKSTYQAMALKVTDKPTFAATHRRIGMAIRPVSSVLVKDENKIELVDLGLSVDWANSNLGADCPEGIGDYYAWGETETKDTFTWSNYAYDATVQEGYKFLGKDIAKTQYDQAYMTNNSMCLPTYQQWKELTTKCKLTEKTLNGVKGVELKADNGNSIFIPYTGNSFDGGNYQEGEFGYYWTSTYYSGNDYQSYAQKFGPSANNLYLLRKRTGLSIRPIATDEIPNKNSVATNIKFVDLGLSVKWANMNLGATKETDFGNRYAWGDPEANKKNFSNETYIYYTQLTYMSKDIGKDIAKTEYDAVYKLDNNVCTPTADQWSELVSKCTWTSKTLNGVNGEEVKGPNGNTIFIPYSGYKNDGKVEKLGTSGTYLSSTTYSSNTNRYAKDGSFTNGKNIVSYSNKMYGKCIRPVSVKTKDTKKSIEPLIPYKWSQGAPFNNLLPKDPTTNKAVATGCTNTALAMIIAYYGCIGVNGKKYRRGCTKTSAYTSSKGNTKISIPSLEPITIFDYDNLNFIKSSDFKTTEAKNAVATLMKYVGFASKANYSSSGTSTNLTKCMNAIKDNLRLGSNPKMIYASSGIEEFKEQIYKELIEGYPVHMSGWNSSGSGGHTFVCDGYDATTGKFHFNWGWSGSYNGWFDIALLKPSSSDFSYSKRCIIGIHPEYIFGDMNDDTLVNVSDVMVIVHSILEKMGYDPQLDVNSDGTIGEDDIEVLVNYILGNKI
jgi:hypothetical protein